MRIGLTGIVVDDQDQAERSCTQVLGLKGRDRRALWPGGALAELVFSEEPTGWSSCCT
jgi:hypothetical protein